MTPFGWVLMIVVWTVALGITGWCYAKLLSAKPSDKPHRESSR
jgi:hypothetical protein